MDVNGWFMGIKWYKHCTLSGYTIFGNCILNHPKWCGIANTNIVVCTEPKKIMRLSECQTNHFTEDMMTRTNN